MSSPYSTSPSASLRRTLHSHNPWSLCFSALPSLTPPQTHSTDILSNSCSPFKYLYWAHKRQQWPKRQGQLHGCPTSTGTQDPTLRRTPTLGLRLYYSHLDVLTFFNKGPHIFILHWVWHIIYLVLQTGKEVQRWSLRWLPALVLPYSRNMTLHKLTTYSTRILLIASYLSVLTYKMGMKVTSVSGAVLGNKSVPLVT